jgi:Lipase (class 3)
MSGSRTVVQRTWWILMMIQVFFFAMHVTHCVSSFVVRCPPSSSLSPAPCRRPSGGCDDGACGGGGARYRKISGKAPTPSSTPSSFLSSRLYSRTPGQVASVAASKAAQAAMIQWRRPSVSTVIAWILAFILLRTKWNTLPNWLRHLALLPYRRLIRNPFAKLRQRFWKSRDDNSAFTSQTATTTTARLEKALTKTRFFGDEGRNDDIMDDDGSSSRILGKLQKAMSLAQAATDSIVFDGFQMQVALLVMLQMVEKSKKSTAELWDKFYESSGQPLLTNTTSTVESFKKSDSSNNADSDTAATTNPVDTLITTWIDLLHLADWAYLDETNDIRNKLEEQEKNTSSYKWHLLRHVKTNEPGRVGHYIALDTNAKVALIAVKGTSDVADMITDACGLSVRYNMTSNVNNDDDKNGEPIGGPEAEAATTTTVLVACHEGILDASWALAHDIQPLVEELFLPAGYNILLVGHSLGAGVACMVGNLLRTRLPALCKPYQQQQRTFPVIDDGNETPSIALTLPLEVVAFAPPPMLNLEAAVATSDFTTSIVNNDDMIPRTSVSNLVSLIRFLAIVDKRLGEKGFRPTGPVGAVQLLTKVLVGGSDDDGENDAIMTGQEIFDGLNEARGQGTNSTTNYRQQVMDDMDHLFVPGKVVVLYEKHGTVDEYSIATANVTSTTKSNSGTAEEPNEALEGKRLRERLTARVRAIGSVARSLAKRRVALTRERIGNRFTSGIVNLNSTISDMLYKKKDGGDEAEDKEEAKAISACAIVADGAAPVLRHINLNRRMISDHMPEAYEKTLRALLQRKG